MSGIVQQCRVSSPFFWSSVESVTVNLWSIPSAGLSPDVVETDTAPVSLGSTPPENPCSCEAAGLDQATAHGAVKSSQTDDEISVPSPVAPQGRGSPSVTDIPLR
jgi:hypothetical protein